MFSYVQREFRQAIEKLSEVIRQAPALPHAYQMLGLMYEETRQPAKALPLYIMAASLSDKHNVQQWWDLAYLAKKHGEKQHCAYCLQKVLAVKPDNQDAQWEYALVLSEMGSHRKAERVLLQLLRNRPDDANVVHRLVRAYHRLGHSSKAIHILEAILAPARPGIAASAADPHTINMLLELLIEAGRFREALTRLSQYRTLAAQAAGGGGVRCHGGSDRSGGADRASSSVEAAAQAAEAAEDDSALPVELPLEIVIKEGVCHAYLGVCVHSTPTDRHVCVRMCVQSIPPAPIHAGCRVAPCPRPASLSRSTSLAAHQS